MRWRFRTYIIGVTVWYVKLTFLLTTLPFTRTVTTFVAVADFGTPITTSCDTGPRAV